MGVSIFSRTPASAPPQSKVTPKLAKAITDTKYVVKAAAFEDADTTNDGALTKEEFAAMLKDDGRDQVDVDHLFKIIDVDSSGTITRQEFMRKYELIAAAGVAPYDEDHTYPGLRGSTRRMLYNLMGFLRARDSVEATARGTLTGSKMDQFASFKHEHLMRQKAKGGGGPVANYEELREVCEPAVPLLERLMRAIVAAAGLDPSERRMYKGKPLPLDAHHCPGVFFDALTMGPLKSRRRCDEKVANEYGGEYDCIVDCVRCSVVVDTEDQLVSVASKLSSMGVPLEAASQPPPEADGNDDGKLPKFIVARLKNRYTAPLFNGYRDALYNIVIDGGKGAWVICEVQLHLAAVLSHKEILHKYYEVGSPAVSPDAPDAPAAGASPPSPTALAPERAPRKGGRATDRCPFSLVRALGCGRARDTHT